jgi:hypothetical protein
MFLFTPFLDLRNDITEAQFKDNEEIIKSDIITSIKCQMDSKVQTKNIK